MVFLLLTPSFCLAAHNLDDCFKAALSRSETIAIEEEQVQQAEERYSRARGSLFPTINAIGSFTRLPEPSGQETAFTKVERPEARITATQPIFRGLREFAALKATQLDVAAEQDGKRAAKISLYRDVAENFYQIMSLEQDLRNLKEQIALSQRRVSELTSRRKIGRSRTSEVLTVQSTVATLEAQAATLQATLVGVREAFAFLTGLEQHATLKDTETVPSRIDPVYVFLKRIEQRPDVAALVKQAEVADQNVSIARGAHLPTVDVSGNYYLKRTGVQESQKWDVTALLVVPLFAGGAIQSQVREASSQRRQSELALSAVRRRAEQEIRSLWQYVQIDQKQLDALVRAAELAERNYHEQTKEYGFGLVTNLDVLQSLNVFQEARRNLDRIRYQAKLDIIRLEAAVAIRPKSQKSQ